MESWPSGKVLNYVIKGQSSEYYKSDSDVCKNKFKDVLKWDKARVRAEDSHQILGQ